MSKRVTTALMLFLFALLVLLIYAMAYETPVQVAKTLEVSIIVRTGDDAHWTVLRQGINQAAEDFNAEVRFLTLPDGDATQQQKQLISREIEGGADALLVCAIAGSVVGETLIEASKKLPVVTFESPIFMGRLAVSNDKRIAHIACDDEAMGQMLGEKLMQDTQNQTAGEIVLLCSPYASDAVHHRELAIARALENCSVSWRREILPQSSAEVQQQLETLLTDPDKILIALETAVVQQCIKGAAGKEQHAKIYGIGAGEVIASAIEQRVLEATVVHNDFAIGYLALKSAVDAVRKHPKDAWENPNFALVTRYNMYTPETEKLMFPLVR